MKPKAQIRWGLWLWLAIWILGLFQMESLLWRELWAGLAIVYAGAYYLVSRDSVDRERGLLRASGVLIGLMCVQIAVVIFLAFEAAGKR